MFRTPEGGAFFMPSSALGARGLRKRRFGRAPLVFAYLSD